MAKMRLSGIPILTEVIPIREGIELEVRGINLADLVSLLNGHAPAMMKVWEKVKEQEAEFTVDIVKKIVRDMAVEFPDMLAAIIALSANDYNDAGIAVARQLSISNQAVILEAIARLSFQSDSSLEKLVLLVVKALQEATRAVKMVRTPISEDGSGGFAGTLVS
jgi:hypothetical protein